MAISLRTIQAALNAGGFSVQEQNAMFNSQVFYLQNYLSTTTANNGTTTLADAIVSGSASAGPTLGMAMQVELGEYQLMSENNIWVIEAHFQVTTNATAGIKFQVTTYDGLTILAASDFTNWINYTANTNPGATAPTSATVAGTTTPNTPISVQNANLTVASIDLFGLVRVNGYGRIGLQFAQAAASGNSSIPSGYFAAYSILG